MIENNTAMQREPSTREYSFIHFSAAWYGPEQLKKRGEVIDDIVISGPHGEFIITWVENDGEGASPQLRAFDDGWKTLFESGLTASLAELDSKRVSPLEMVKLLLSLGYRDETPRERPAYLKTNRP